MNLSSQERESEKIKEKICNFFAKNGIPIEKTKDPTFIQLLHALNSDIQQPTISQLKNWIDQKISSSESHYENRNNVSITMDLVNNEQKKFLCFSAHFLDEQNLRRNLVFLKKIDSFASKLLIIREIESSVFGPSHMCIGSYFPARLTGSPFVIKKQLDSVETCEAVSRKCYVCCYSLLEEFINIVLSNRSIVFTLNNFKRFIAKLRIPVNLERFKTFFQQYRNIEPDIPEIGDSWKEICTMLEKWNEFHEYLNNFCSIFRIETFSVEETERLLSLHKLLSIVKQVGHQISKPESTQSEVIPNLIRIKNSIKSSFEKNLEMGLTVQAIFNNTVGHILLPKFSNEDYEFSTLLDKRFSCDSSIFPTERWNAILLSFQKMIVMNKPPILTMKDVDYFKKLHHEVEMFLDVNKTAETPDVWWAHHQLFFPILYKYAKCFVTIPASSIDGERFFGKNGKFAHMITKMETNDLNKVLKLATNQETYCGGGFIERISGTTFVLVLNKKGKRTNDVLMECPSTSEKQIKLEVPDEVQITNTVFRVVKQENEEKNSALTEL